MGSLCLLFTFRRRVLQSWRGRSLSCLRSPLGFLRRPPFRCPRHHPLHCSPACASLCYSSFSCPSCCPSSTFHHPPTCCLRCPSACLKCTFHATAAPFTAHQPVSAGLTSNLVNVAATPVTHHATHIARPIAHTASHVAHPVSLPALTHTAHVARPVVTHASHGPTHFTHPAIHASHIARPVVHGPIYRSGIALHGKPFTAFNKEESEDKEEGGEEEERSSGLTYFKFANKEEEEEKEEETEEEERSARVIEDTSEVFNDIDLEETSQNLIVDPEDLNEVSEEQLEVEGRTVEEVSSTTTSATTTTTMAPTDILQKVKEELGEEPKISVEEDVLV